MLQRRLVNSSQRLELTGWSLSLIAAGRWELAPRLRSVGHPADRSSTLPAPLWALAINCKLVLSVQHANADLQFVLTLYVQMSMFRCEMEGRTQWPC